MAGDGTNSEDTYAAARRELGEALTELKRERGAPSYDRIRARGVKLFGDQSALAKASMSEIFAGQRGPASLSRLLWLVRTLLAYDDGEETAPPGRGDPRLESWRERWHTIETTRAAARRRDDSTTVPASPQEPRPRATHPHGKRPAGAETAPGADAPVNDARDIDSAAPTKHPQEGGTSLGQPHPEPLTPSATRRFLTAPTSIFAVGQRLTHGHRVNAVAFSPDGRLLATASADQTVRLWDTETHNPVGEPLIGHVAEVNAVAFSPDGRLLATASADQTVRLWDTETHNP
ncbi:WD40 repeat domain-containing protein, partial [Streptomyces puniciscabiei]|uniref:WD40 repeat domain-containing protein n=1 Tax=Streptomyces puniciscabiei TaxID=164348 RepID=UPI0033595617